MSTDRISDESTNIQLSETCGWCGSTLSTGEEIITTETGESGAISWLHQDCRLAQQRWLAEGYESRQYVEMKEGVVLGGSDRQHIEYRKRVPESYRFHAQDVDWTDFIGKIRDLIPKQVDLPNNCFLDPPSEIYIVGSLATGNAIPGSDVDIVLGFPGKAMGLTLGRITGEIQDCVEDYSDELIATVDHPLSEVSVVRVTDNTRAPFIAWQLHYGHGSPRQLNPNPIYDAKRKKIFHDPKDAKDVQK